MLNYGKLPNAQKVFGSAKAFEQASKFSAGGNEYRYSINLYGLSGYRLNLQPVVT